MNHSIQEIQKARALTDRIKEEVQKAPARYAELERLKSFLASNQEEKTDNRKVYAILARQSQKMKIGVAANPKDRLRTIQGMCPEPLVLFAVTQGGGAKLEGLLHKRLSEWHDHGEWFHINPKMIAVLREEETWLAIK